jgi:hypothetical protein
VRQILLHPLGIFDSYVCLIQNKIFFGTLRRISDLTNLDVTSRAFSCFLNPGLYGRGEEQGQTRHGVPRSSRRCKHGQLGMALAFLPFDVGGVILLRYWRSRMYALLIGIV